VQRASIAKRPALWLSLCVAVAFLPRLLTNVILRPEFVGWFNHSPYYWVQTRALLRDGNLAYEDMPALFELYAAIATVFGWLGAAFDDAIVLASRLSMAIVPALIPLATYRLAQIANAGKSLQFAGWSIVLASGFLPLTYAHMPETLQKNMLGMLLLAFALVALLTWLKTKSIARLAVVLVLAVAIISVHLGSGLAVLLLFAAITLDRIFRMATPKGTAQSIAIIATLALLLFALVSTFYPGAMDRASILLAAFIPQSVTQASGMVALLALWLGISIFVWRWTRQKTSEWDSSVATLARVCLLWVCLLALPFWPGEIGMRLMLFVPLAGIALVVVVLAHVGQRWIRFGAVAVATGFLALSIGEAVSQAMIYTNKDNIADELDELRESYQLQRTDLVITPYGVGPTANWFLGTKAALLTAVTKDIFNQHDRVFVLNTLERPAPILEADSCNIVKNEFDRYQTTRHDIPLTRVTKDAAFEYFAIFKLEAMPAIWHFDTDGNWIGWGDCEESGRGERI